MHPPPRSLLSKSPIPFQTRLILGRERPMLAQIRSVPEQAIVENWKEVPCGDGLGSNFCMNPVPMKAPFERRLQRTFDGQWGNSYWTGSQMKFTCQATCTNRLQNVVVVVKPSLYRLVPRSIEHSYCCGIVFVHHRRGAYYFCIISTI